MDRITVCKQLFALAENLVPLINIMSQAQQLAAWEAIMRGFYA